MPAHYPSFYDYMDIEIGNKIAMHPTTAPSTNIGSIVIGVAVAVFIILAILTTAFVCCKYEAV